MLLLLGDVISLGVVMTLLTLVALTATDRFIEKHYYLVVLYQWINLVNHKSVFPIVQSVPISPHSIEQC